MKHLTTTTALALVLGATAFAAPAAAVDREPGYCGQSWVQVDANDDGKVTQSEAEAAFATEFSAIDESGDDIISRDEYRECRTSQMKSAARQMNDADRTGSQPLKDRQSAANADSQGKKSAIQAQSLQQLLQAADANQDGVVTRGEYATAARKAYDDAHRAEASDPSLVVLRRFIVVTPEQGGQGQAQTGEQAQTGQSGGNAAVGKMNSDEAAARSAMKFSMLDQDGDGDLTRSEWSAEATAKMSQDRADERFASFDADGNGTVTRDEYRDARSAMMSEAQEAIQAWDEPQTLSEGQASGQQAGASASQNRDTASSGQEAAEQSAGITGASEAGQEQEADESQEAAVPVFIYRFHTM